MAGYTDRAARLICRRFGADFTESEMVSARALVYQDRKSAPLARLYPDELPGAVQLFGSEPSVIAEAAKIVAAGTAGGTIPTAIDLNFGCPVKKIVSNGEGSALMRDPNSGTVEEEVRSKGGYVITWQIAGKSYETVCLKDETPHYDGSLELPSNLFDYTFLSWDHTPRAASRDETYVARFRMERNDVTLEGKTLREQYRLIRAAILLLDCSSAGYAGASDRIAELDALAAAYAENVGTVNAAFSQVLFGAD